MSDPVRLLSLGSSDGDAFEHDLLASARNDRAPLDSEERALASLGVAGVAVTLAASAKGSAGALTGSTVSASSAGSSASTASAAGTSVTTAATSFAPVALKATSGLVFVKWVGVGVLALAAAAGAYKVTGQKETQAGWATDVTQDAPGTRGLEELKNASTRGAPQEIMPAAAAVPAPVAAGATGASEPTSAITLPLPTPAMAADAPMAEAKVSPAEERKVATPSGSSASSGSSATARPSDSSASLAGELALVDRARSALAHRDAASASAALDEYARKYPRGTMLEEATVARIETLLLAGQAAMAASQAELFLKEHPASTNTKRVRLLSKRAIAEAGPH
jgi:hypothetical protein